MCLCKGPRSSHPAEKTEREREKEVGLWPQEALTELESLGGPKNIGRYNGGSHWGGEDQRYKPECGIINGTSYWGGGGRGWP